MIFSGRRGARFLAVVVVMAMVASVPEARADTDADETSSVARTTWDVTWQEIGTGVVDLVILRPLVFAGSAVGFVGFLVSLPLNAAAKNTGASWDAFVVAPVKYTFVRPVGEF